MTDAWSNPHDQQDYIPSISDGSNPTANGQPQIDTQRDVDNAAQRCPCPWCSGPRYDHRAASPARDYQNPLFPINPAAPYANQPQDIANPAGIATITNGQMMAQPVGQQALVWDQENDRYAPRYEAVGFLQAQSRAAPNQAQLDMRALDSLRRFAERYSNNPESLTNAGPSGRPQVVIMLIIPDGAIN